MIQDMMLGTIEKSRVREIQDEDDFWKAKLKKLNPKKGKTIAEDKNDKSTKKLNDLKPCLIEEFLKSKYGQEKVEKVELEERDLIQNPMKYDIIEEQNITESEDMLTARKALSSFRKDENINGKDNFSMKNKDLLILDKQIMIKNDEEEHEGGEIVEEAEDKQNTKNEQKQPDNENIEDNVAQNKDLVLDEDDKSIDNISEIK